MKVHKLFLQLFLTLFFFNSELVSQVIYPQELVTYNRADIGAKYLYARHWNKGVENIWAKEVYTEHLRNWNKFYERDGLR